LLCLRLCNTIRLILLPLRFFGRSSDSRTMMMAIIPPTITIGPTWEGTVSPPVGGSEEAGMAAAGVAVSGAGKTGRVGACSGLVGNVTAV